ncbi:MAG: helix-turn-helix domain-containing protein [Actinomycetota bacterium]|nr:helix-turn-helix domain-containing protein [Actinomycetota bacterium]
MTPNERNMRAAQVQALRRAGLSIAQIKDATGIRNNQTLTSMLAATTPPRWTARPRAKDDKRAAARQLRSQGRTLREIAAELGVSRSSASTWTSDVELPGDAQARTVDRVTRSNRSRWATTLRRNERERQQAKLVAAREVVHVTDRELLLLGAVAYWCEGSKSKPWQRRERLGFINSDPMMIRLFLRWLELVHVEAADIRLRLSIHESADVMAAEEFWSRATGLAGHPFARPTLKRHNPATVRANTGVSYHGCLIITVVKFVDLYRRIEGLVAAIDLAPRDAQHLGLQMPSWVVSRLSDSTVRSRVV